MSGRGSHQTSLIDNSKINLVTPTTSAQMKNPNDIFNKKSMSIQVNNP
jgi:hypothetical protein